MVENPKRKITPLTTASDLYESWKQGNPAITEELVRDTYVQAEKDARAALERLGANFTRSPVIIVRLQELGINSETLESLDSENS